MKTRLEKLKDIDFWVSIGAIGIGGIALITLVAINLYTAQEVVWPLFVFLGDIAFIVIFKGVFLFLIDNDI